MKKLFELGSSITIDEFSTLRINGPYTLMKVGPNYAVLKSGDYEIEAMGEDLRMDTLAEEVAVISFTSIESISVKAGTGDVT